MKTYFISASTFCMERMLDCQKIADYLKLNGWRPAKRAGHAGLIMISTCSFGREEDESSLDYIRFYLNRKRPGAQVLIMGCLPAINPQTLSPFKHIPTLSPTTLADIEKIVSPEAVQFAEVPEPNKISAAEVTHNVFLKKALWLRSYLVNAFRNFKPDLNTFKAGAAALGKGIRYLPVMKTHINPFLSCNRNGFYYLRISKGCLGSCSYCAKKYSTGNVHSKPFRTIINEFEAGLNAGEKRFYLLTEDVGCYGLDQQSNIVALLDAIFKAGASREFQIVISNFNARWFVKYYDDLAPLFAVHRDKITYVQIPIQSGSSRVLKFMDRHYTIEEVSSRLLDLRTRAPGINLTTDIIAGFPGETEEDFELTKEFLEKIRFQHVDIFGYEKRPHTRAGKLPGDLAPDVINRRVLALARLQNHYSSRKTIAKKILDVIQENLQRYRIKSAAHTP